MNNSDNDKNNCDAHYTSLRLQMVERQLIRRGIRDNLVLNAMRTVPRHKFIPYKYRDRSYQDGPQPGLSIDRYRQAVQAIHREFLMQPL